MSEYLNGTSKSNYTGFAFYYVVKNFTVLYYYFYCKNATFSIDQNGYIEWTNGDFLFGIWNNGQFNNGNFGSTQQIEYDLSEYNVNQDIIKLETKWYNGQFNNGTFVDGYWYNGSFNNGQFNGQWYNGQFNNGIFKGIWNGGIFNNGAFYGGQFNNGIFGDINKDNVTPTWKTLFSKWFNGIWEKGVVRKTNQQQQLIKSNHIQQPVIQNKTYTLVFDTNTKIAKVNLTELGVTNYVDFTLIYNNKVFTDYQYGWNNGILTVKNTGQDNVSAVSMNYTTCNNNTTSTVMISDSSYINNNFIKPSDFKCIESINNLDVNKSNYYNFTNKTVVCTKKYGYYGSSDSSVNSNSSISSNNSSSSACNFITFSFPKGKKYDDVSILYEENNIENQYYIQNVILNDNNQYVLILEEQEQHTINNSVVVIFDNKYVTLYSDEYDQRYYYDQDGVYFILKSNNTSVYNATSSNSSNSSSNSIGDNNYTTKYYLYRNTNDAEELVGESDTLTGQYKKEILNDSFQYVEIVSANVIYNDISFTNNKNIKIKNGNDIFSIYFKDETQTRQNFFIFNFEEQAGSYSQFVYDSSNSSSSLNQYCPNYPNSIIVNDRSDKLNNYNDEVIAYYLGEHLVSSQKINKIVYYNNIKNINNPSLNILEDNVQSNDRYQNISGEYNYLVEQTYYPMCISNATFRIENGNITWYKGTWKDGIWYNGSWNINKKDSTSEWLLYSTQQNNGIIYDSVINCLWENGTWLNGTWYTLQAKWENGTWRSGFINDIQSQYAPTFEIINGSNYENYTSTERMIYYYNNKFYHVQCKNATFNIDINGIITFINGIWKDGFFNDGVFGQDNGQSVWENGTFNGGTFYKGQWKNGNWQCYKNNIKQTGLNVWNIEKSTWQVGYIYGTKSFDPPIYQIAERNVYYRGKNMPMAYVYQSSEDTQPKYYKFTPVNGNFYIDSFGNIQWNSGDWLYGIWNNGIWNSGRFYSHNENQKSVWKNGVWKNGVWGGTWSQNSTFTSSATWEGGTWIKGYLGNAYSQYSPITTIGNSKIFNKPYTGIVNYLVPQEQKCYWFDAKNAYFNIDENGNITWHKGQFNKGTWYNGQWHNSIIKASESSAFVTFEDTTDSITSIWNDGIFMAGVWYYGNWKQGQWLMNENNQPIGQWKDGLINGVRSDTAPTYLVINIDTEKVFQFANYSGGIKYEYEYCDSKNVKQKDYYNMNVKKATFNISYKNHQKKVFNMTLQFYRPSIMWTDGVWVKGVWSGGQWKRGQWNDGTWVNGTWHDGVWKNGTMHQCAWYNGIWYNGTANQAVKFYHVYRRTQEKK